LVIYYFYHTCDPLKSGRITVRDQNMPLYVVDAIGHIPGLAGLFVSGIFAAGLSSISSSLNALSAITVEDYFKPLYLLIKKKPYSPGSTKSALVSKIIAAGYGCLTIGLAFLAQYLGGVLQASLTVFGVIGGPLLALFTLGMCTTRATDYGSSMGLLIGISISMWIGFGEPKPPPPFLEFSTENCTKFLPDQNFILRSGGVEKAVDGE
jgi:sodium-coupled monocarboxylate transporter 8/12